MLLRRLLIATAVLVGAIVSSTVMAMQSNYFERDNLGTYPIFRGEDLSITMDYHVVEGETHEIVYEGPDRLSELVWPIHRLFMIDTLLHYQSSPSFSWDFLVSFRGSSGKSTMSDTDWDPEDTNNPVWVYSESKNDLSAASEYSATLTFHAYDSEEPLPILGQVRWDWLASYRTQFYAFRSIGGTEWYNPLGIERSGTQVRSFAPGQTGIKFEHSLYLPLLGTAITFDKDRLSLRLHGFYTPVATSNDVDEHRLRDIVFNDSISGAEFWEAGLNLRYEMFDDFFLTTRYSYAELKETRGDVEIVDNSWWFGGTYYFQDTAGISHRSHSFGLGVAYQF